MLEKIFFGIETKVKSILNSDEFYTSQSFYTS